jgi:hypothetical protein
MRRGDKVIDERYHGFIFFVSNCIVSVNKKKENNGKSGIKKGVYETSGQEAA